MFSLALISTASAAGSITLTPTAQAPGATVTITGTGFGATKTVGIGLGGEVAVSGEAHTPTGTGTGPYMTRTNFYPLKPGSLTMHSDVSGTESDWTDNGDGTIQGSGTYAAGGTVNYATGVFGRSSTTDISSYTIVFTANYVRYQYNVTPAGALNTTSSGTFTTTITVPAGLANSNYNVTVIDSGGARAVATLNVNSAIPEALPLGAMMLLTIFAAAAGSWYFRKRPTIATRTL